MNFIGHLHVASWTAHDPRFLLGAMLPDFASMAGVRLGPIAQGQVAEGVAHHHRTDDAFHSAELFNTLVRAAVEQLSELGVERGPARAVGHVGVEMLIDGQLLHEAKVGASYLSALVAFQDVPSAAFGAPAAALSSLVERLTHYGIPYDYERPEAVTARLTSMLARRPRLALSPAAQAVVGSIMPDLKARVVGQLPALLSHLAHGLSHRRYSETITG